MMASAGDKSPAQHMQVLRTRVTSPKGFHALRRGFQSPAVPHPADVTAWAMSVLEDVQGLDV